MIAIAFAGMYLDALLGLVGRARLSEASYEKIELEKYEKKLRRLGIDDQTILANCTRFREARNDLIHEKALVFEVPGLNEKIHTKDHKEGISKKETYGAQDEAAFGVEFVKSIGRMLQSAPQPVHREPL